MRRVLLISLCAVALTAPAQAQHPQLDPDSPAGSEYQLPIDRARERADAPRAAHGRGSSGAAPLFGTGVPARGQEHNKPRAACATGDRHRDPKRPATPEPARGTRTPALRAQAPSPDDGGSGLVAVGGAALGVLLLGGLAGLVWRRRSVPR
jgi:hypothetical protein